MTVSLWGMSTGSVVLLALGVAVALSVLAAFLGRALVRRGLREPFVVRLINRASEQVVGVIKRPITSTPRRSSG